ncbi:hypothetical protein ACFQZZ_14565 [Nocardia sp. GCM10030253]|uniref:hypothetical protein n=1 Tax=Nocardia sp. GCM10030253 TaxID=3273404 RepID=UPI0036430D04
MNPNIIRPASIGVTAGVVAGIVTVAGIIIGEDHDVFTRIEESIARLRLSPAERTEFDRIKDHKATLAAAIAHTAKEKTAVIRSGFRPGLLGGKAPVATLEELSVPALIVAIDAAIDLRDGQQPRDPWSAESKHLAALRNEFERRWAWEVRHRLPRLDQLRLEAAERRVTGSAFAVPLWRPEADTTYTPAGPPYPAFEGPASAHYSASTDSSIANEKEI